MERQPEWFDADRIRRLVSYKDLIAKLELGLHAVEKGEIREQRDSGIRDPVASTAYLAYPAAWPAMGLATIKILSTTRRNLVRGLPLIHAIVAAIDTETGEIPALLDGGQLTAMRTAALSAIAARKLLGSGRKDRLTIAVVGTGDQGRAHIEAFATQFPSASLLLASGRDDLERAVHLSEQFEGVCPVRLHELRPADIVVCCTAARQPLFLDEALKPDAVVTSIAPFLPNSGEIGENLVRAARTRMSDDPARVRERWHHAPLPPVMSLTEEVPIPANGRRVFLATGRPFADLVVAWLVLATRPHKEEGAADR